MSPTTNATSGSQHASSQHAAAPSRQSNESARDESCGIAGYAHQATDEYPLTSVIVSLGIGVGAGLLLSGLISGSSSRSDDRNMALKLGDRMLQSLNHAVPQSVKNLWSS